MPKVIPKKVRERTIKLRHEEGLSWARDSRHILIMMNLWEVAILKSIICLGGQPDLAEIYERPPAYINLTKDDLRETRWRGRPAFQHQVRSHIANLCQAGELYRVSRGRYSVTQKGERRGRGR